MSDHLIAEANRHARALIIERSAPNAPRPPDSLRPQMSTPIPTPRTCGEISCDECNDRYAALAAECDQLRLDCENETKWAAHYLAQSIADKARAERAEDNLAALEQCHDDNCRGVVKIADELATERARLDSGRILLTVSGERVWHCGVDLRAAIDAGIKEDAK